MAATNNKCCPQGREKSNVLGAKHNVVSIIWSISTTIAISTSYVIKNASLSEEQEGLDTRLSQTTSSGSIRSNAYQNLWTCPAWTMVMALSPPSGTTGLSGMIGADYNTTKLNWFSQRRGNQPVGIPKALHESIPVRASTAQRHCSKRVFFFCYNASRNESLRKASTSECWRYNMI